MKQTKKIQFNHHPITSIRILHEARQRRARIRARTEEIIQRQSQMTYNNQTMKKELLCWVVFESCYWSGVLFISQVL